MNVQKTTAKILRSVLPLNGRSSFLVAITFIVYFAVVAFSFWNDAQFFKFEFKESTSYATASGNPHVLAFYITVKIVFLVLSYCAVRALCSMAYEVAHGNEDRRRQLFITGALFLVYSVIFVIIFPGIWWHTGTDEFTHFSLSMHLQVHHTQGFGMSLFMMLAQMLYGHPGTVIFVQYSIGCVIMGFIIYDLHYKKHKTVAAAILAILFFTPFMVYFAFFPMRAYLTGMFFGLFLYTYYCLSGDLKSDRRLLVRMTLLAVAIVNLRVEMLFLLLAFPIMLVLKYRKKGENAKPAWKLGFCSFAVVALSVVIATGWSALGNKTSMPTHDMYSFLAPLGEVLAHDENAASKEELALIDEFFDVQDMIKEHSTPAHFKGFRYERFGKKSNASKFPKEDYLKCQLTIFKILAQHPDVYLYNKAKMAFHTLGFTSDGRIGHATPSYIDPEELKPFFNTKSSQLSKWTKRFLAGDYQIGPISAKQLCFPTWIPLLLTLVYLVVSIVARRKTTVIMCIVVLVTYCLVYLAAVSNWVMYYFPSGFAGLLVLAVTLNDTIVSLRANKKSKAAQEQGA